MYCKTESELSLAAKMKQTCDTLPSHSDDNKVKEDRSLCSYHVT